MKNKLSNKVIFLLAIFALFVTGFASRAFTDEKTSDVGEQGITAEIMADTREADPTASVIEPTVLQNLPKPAYGDTAGEYSRKLNPARVRLYFIEGQELQSWELIATDIALSEDGTMLFVGTVSGELFVFSTETAKSYT